LDVIRAEQEQRDRDDRPGVPGDTLLDAAEDRRGRQLEEAGQHRAAPAEAGGQVVGKAAKLVRPIGIASPVPDQQDRLSGRLIRPGDQRWWCQQSPVSLARRSTALGGWATWLTPR